MDTAARIATRDPARRALICFTSLDIVFGGRIFVFFLEEPNLAARYGPTWSAIELKGGEAGGPTCRKRERRAAPRLLTIFSAARLAMHSTQTCERGCERGEGADD